MIRILKDNEYDLIYHDPVPSSVKLVFTDLACFEDESFKIFIGPGTPERGIFIDADGMEASLKDFLN